jgi:hypothetical protein
MADLTQEQAALTNPSSSPKTQFVNISTTMVGFSLSEPVAAHQQKV